MAPTTKKIKKKDEHKCPHCSKVLKNRPSYLLHQKLHTDQYPFSCSICPYKCKIKKYLTRHVKDTHNQANGPDCPICGKVFHYLSFLKKHMRMHTGEYVKPFQCSFCDYVCRDRSSIRKHQERHMRINKTYPCEKCKKIFKTTTLLSLHIDEVHYGLNIRKLCCDKCGKAFKTKATLRIHVKSIHDKSFRTECDICGQSISKSSVGLHLTTHVDIRPFKCSFKHCGKKYKERGSLTKHTLTHYPELQYQCDQCDCRFPTKSRLRDHKLRHTANGTFTCDYCGGSFTSKRYLLSHIKNIHSKNPESFICDECGSVNYSKRAIISHLRYGHGSEHDRKCQICSDILTDSKVLTDHYWKRHSVRYVVQKKKGDKVVIKDEPIEDLTKYDFDYDVQKIEVDEYIPDPQYADTETTLAYSERVLAEDISRSIGEKDSAQHPESTFDEIYIEHVVDKPGVGEHIPDPEYVEIETTLSYSKSVLEEDILRCILERDKGHQPESDFDEFFVQVMNKLKKKGARVPEKPALATNTRDAEDIASTPFSEDCRDSVESIIDSDVRDSSSSCNNIQSYICDKCKKVFNDKILLIAHIHEHSVTGDKPYKCDVCMKCFTQKGNLVKHYRLHTGDKPYKCDVCMKCFTQKGNLVKHYRLHTGDKPYKCDICMKCFTRKTMLSTHYRIHTGDKPYKCDVCMKCFTQKGNLVKHYRLHTGDKPYKCDICMKCFTTNTMLSTHYRLHTGDKPYKCDVCMKCFTQKGNLVKHYRLHTSDKLYTCDACMKCFRQKSSLVKHYRLHTGDKPYKCDICMKCFTTKTMLSTHYRIHTGDKPYKCDVCSKEFTQKGQLDAHHLIHTGDKLYKCDVCMKCFTQKGNLVKHYRLHTGDKPYKCDVCMKCFRDKHQLSAHYRLHTGDKPYKCDVCMKCFRHKHHLVAHCRVHTSDKP